MEIKMISSSRGKVKSEKLVKQIQDYLNIKPNSKDEGHKKSI
jgi:hypothetical protein